MHILFKKRQPSRPTTPAYSTIALGLPDIILQIFFFLAPAQIRFGAGRVCKQWHSLSHRYIDNFCTWDSMATIHQELKFSQKLKFARTFQCQYHENYIFDASNNNEIRKSLTKVIEYLTDEEHKRIKRLIVRFENTSSNIPIQVFAPFRSLVFLELRSKPDFIFPMDTLLAMFPSLNEISLGFFNLDLKGKSALARERPETPWPSSTTKLRALSLRLMTIDLALLEDLLSVCPDLKELKLTEIRQEYPESFQHQQYGSKPDVPPLFDGVRFFSSVAARCPNLEMLVFSEQHCSLSAQNMNALIRTFPDLKSYGLAISSLKMFYDVAFLPVHIMKQPDHLLSVQFIYLLTTLEITSYTRSSTSRSPGIMSIDLHNILCAAPNLLHLSAWESLLSTGIMDYGSLRVDENQVWACRQLKTFAVIVLPTSSYNHYNDRGNHKSRMFFAYLVKCCPYLRDIYIQESDLSLRLEGGLCLLSDLKELENLVVYTRSTYTMQKQDLDWLSTLGGGELSIRDKLRRWQTPSKLNEDSIIESEESRKLQKLVKSKACTYSYADTILWHAILKAGSLEGIKEILERTLSQQKEGEFCWTKLATFWIPQEHMAMARKQRPQLALQGQGHFVRRRGLGSSYNTIPYFSVT